MTIKNQVISAPRAGLSSVIVTDNPTYLKTWLVSNVGAEDTSHLLTLSAGAAEMDGAASVAFTGLTNPAGAAEMDGQALVQWTSGVVEAGAAHMDGAASASMGGGFSESAAAQMDGATDVEFSGARQAIGAAQMDGLTSAAFVGGEASGAVQADGAAMVACTGAITGGFNIGAAEMDGLTNVAMAGVASIIVTATAEMDGAASMLAVQSGVPLPPHGIILAAGI